MNLTGTKLACDVCGSQAVVVTEGEGEVHCHDQPMKVVAGAPGGAGRPSGRAAPEGAGPESAGED